MTSGYPEIFKYRLIEEIAKHREEIAIEDGIRWDFEERVVIVWLGYKSVGRYIRWNDTDEWIEYSYRIERKAVGGYVWEFDRRVRTTLYNGCED